MANIGQQFINIAGRDLLNTVEEHVQQSAKYDNYVPIQEHSSDDDYSDESVQNPNALGYHLVMAGSDKNRAIRSHNEGNYERTILHLDNTHTHLFEAARAFDRTQKAKTNRDVNPIWISVGEVSKALDNYKNLVRNEAPKGIED